MLRAAVIYANKQRSALLLFCHGVAADIYGISGEINRAAR